MSAKSIIEGIVQDAIAPGKHLTGIELAQLKSGSHIFVRNKRSVVISVTRRGDTVELVYVVGKKVFGPERYYDAPYNSNPTEIRVASYSEEYKITAGMQRAYSKIAVRKCPTCELTVPRYPGRYPKCPHCGTVMQGLDDARKY